MPDEPRFIESLQSDPSPVLVFARAVLNKLDPPEFRYELTRTIFLRALGFIYFIAFLSANRQVLALLGENGCFPQNYFFKMPQITWRREHVGSYLPALSAKDPSLLRYLENHGWSP